MPGSQDFAADPRNASALVYLNGQLVARDAATVSIFDGGFVVGDGVWEGLRLHRGALLFLDRHLDRLYWGAQRIRLNIGLERQALVAEVRRLLAANDTACICGSWSPAASSRLPIRIRVTPWGAPPSPSSPTTSCPIRGC